MKISTNETLDYVPDFESLKWYASRELYAKEKCKEYASREMYAKSQSKEYASRELYAKTRNMTLQQRVVAD